MRILPSIPQERMCRSCLVEYPATAEYFVVRSKGKIGNICKGCAALRAKEYRQRNIEFRHEYEREWRRNNPDKVRAAIHKRRAQKQHVGGAFTEADVKAQYDKQHGECYYCHKKVGGDYHIDHYIPIARGGSNSADNIVIACPSCNFSKRNKLPQEWIDSKSSL